MSATPALSTFVFIDSSLPDLATLRAGLPTDANVHLIDPAHDGLKQIAAALQEQTNISALHLLTHGAPGKLYMGNSAVSQQDLPYYSDALDTIANAMYEDGEWMIYGCEVAAGIEGQKFIDALAVMTGLKVAAATHKVGHAELGGDWQLNVGMPITQTLKVAAWQHVLVDPSLGGVAAEGNLKVVVLTDGSIVVDRFDGTAWNSQFYDADTDQTNNAYGMVSSGTVLEINGIAVALNDYTYLTPAAATEQLTPTSITQSGNTVTVTWQVSAADMQTKFLVAAQTGTLTIEQKITLASDSAQAVDIEWNLTNNTDMGLAAIRLAHVVDSYLAGVDEGKGIWVASKKTVGVEQLTSTGIQQMLLQSTGALAPVDAESRFYEDVLIAATTADATGFSATGLSTTGHIDATPTTDNGYGMEWLVPVLNSGGGIATITATQMFVASSVLTEWADSAPPAGAAGSPIVLHFDVSNVSGVPKTSNYTVEVPTGWNAAVLSVSSNTFGAASDDTGTTHDETTNTATVTVTITPPANATAGDYDVVLKNTTSGTTVQATGTVTVQAPANVVPTFTTLTTLTGGTEDTAKTITFADLQTAGNDADSDGTVTGFVVKSLASGTLTIGGQAWHTTTNNTIDASHEAVWTPAANANSTLTGGALEAFKVVAKDNGGTESATPVAVGVTVAAVQDQPVLQHAGWLYSTNNSWIFMKTDGTTASIASLAYAGVPQPVPVNDGYLVTVRENGADIPKILRADGTLTNIALDGSSNPLYSVVQYILPYGNNKAVMLTNVPDGNGNSVAQLILTDGTEGNTQILTNFSSDAQIRKPTVSGDKVFFLATSVNEGEELWVADLLNPVTPTQLELTSGVFYSYRWDPISAGINTGSITAFNGGVVFTAAASPAGQVSINDGTVVAAKPNALYFSNGTTITQLATGVFEGKPGVIVGSKLIVGLRSDNGASADTYGTWVTDGTVAGTHKLQITTNNVTTDFEYPFQTVDIGNGAAFIVANESRDIYLYSSADNSVVKAIDIPDAYTGMGIYGLLADGTLVLDLMNNQSFEHGLWKVNVNDSTPTLTLIKDGFLNAGSGNDVQIIDGKIWFTATGGATGGTWVTDGTAEGTVKISTAVKGDGVYTPWGKVATDNTAKATPFTTISDAATADTITGNTVAQIVASKMIADPDVVNAPEAIAITALGGTSNGTWQYKMGNGTWTAFDFANNSGKALLLDASDSIRFVPNAGYKGTITDGITFRAWDQTGSETAGTYVATSGKTGVDGIFSAQTASASITVADMTAPVLSTAKVVGDQLTLTYNENRSSTSNPDAGDFTVTVNGNTVNVSSVWSSSLTSPQLVLTLASAVLQGDTVTISYADTGTANPIKDAANNLAANLTNAAVTNNTRPPVTLTTLDPLTVVTATEDAEQVITFAQLAANGDEAGYQVAFKVTGVNGSLKIGTSAQTATAYNSSTNAIIDSTHNAYWTPESNVNGSAVTAFQVKAVDDVGNTSSTSMPVQLAVGAVNDAPTIKFPGGIVATDVGSDWDEAYRIFEMADGKFVTVGIGGNSTNYPMTLARYNADGSLDTTYGTAGKSVLSTVLNRFWDGDATADANGNIYLAGKNQLDGYKAVVVKVKPDGTLDTTAFGTNGIATTFNTAEETATPRGVALATINGETKVVVVSQPSSQSNFAVERFNADGTKDTSFGNGAGYVITDLGGDEYANEVAVQSDGKIVLVGYKYSSGNGEPLAIVRYNTDGMLDMTFNSTGSVIEGNTGTWSSYGNYIYDATVTIQSDGKILVVASADGDALLLARYNTNGSLDSTFGTDGKVAIDWSVGINRPEDVKIDANGNIFVLDYDDDGGDVPVVAKFTSSGVLDSSFGTGGIAALTTDTSAEWAAGSGLELTSDGKIIITGIYADTDTWYGDYMMARLKADGSPDGDFGGAKSYALGSGAVVLGGGVQIADVDATDYSGFTLTVARDGGANVQDVFSASSNLEFASAGVLNYNSSAVGTYTNSGGTLTLTLGAVDGTTLNSIAQSVAYQNTASTVPVNPNLALRWTVNDHNTGNAQGTGAAMPASTVQNLTLLPDTTVPTLASSTPVDEETNAVATGNIVLTFSENVTAVASKNIVIHKSSDDSVVETIAANNTAKVTISGKTVTVNPTNNLDYSTGFYVKIDDGAFKDAANNSFAGIADISTLNFTTGPKAPLYQSASASGSTLTLTYDDPLGTAPDSNAFTVKVNGTVVSNAISNVAVGSGQDTNKLIVTLATPIKFGESLSFSYADPTTGNDANAIQGLTGNDAASLSEYGVSNATAPTSSVNIAIAQGIYAGRSVTLATEDGLNVANPVNTAAPSGLPKNVKMPLGGFGFDITGGNNGFTAQMAITVDASLKQFTYYKFNSATQKWTNIAKSVEITKGADGIAGNADDKAIIRFELVDGGAYDEDDTANGTIKDPGGVAENSLLPVILENETSVGFVAPINPDQVSGTLSYAITGGADSAKFSINSSTGALSFLNAPDFETPSDTGDTAGNNTYAVTVTVTGNNGGSEIQPLIVNVMNVPEAGDPTVDSNVTGVEATLIVTPPPPPPPPPPPTPEPTPETPTPPAPPPVDDGDNVSTTVENQAPGLPTSTGTTVVGDGNGDGVVDSTQADVTSVSFRLTDQISQNPTAPATFITLVGDSKDGAVDTTDSNSVRLTNVTQTDAPANLPEGVSMPLGLISFTANVGIAGITETFSLYVSDGLGINGYWKQDSEGAWVNLASAPYGGKVTDLGDTLRLDFQIQDGGEFDSNPTAGIITDPGAAGHIPLSLLDHSPNLPHDGFWF